MWYNTWEGNVIAIGLRMHAYPEKVAFELLKFNRRV